MLIVRFSDFQCPSCAQTHLDYKPILAKYDGAVSRRRSGSCTKDYPLERECNAGMTRDMHSAACEAAVAVAPGPAKGRGDAMEDWLYANHAR